MHRSTTSWRTAGVAAAATTLALAAAGVAAAAPPARTEPARTEPARTELVDVGSDGVQGIGRSTVPALSADGRFVAFVSDAPTLVPGDTNGVQDVFVRDTAAGTTERISLGVDGAQLDAGSDYPSISADGRHVSFTTDAAAVAGDDNDDVDVLLHDRGTGRTELVSVALDGGAGDDGTFPDSHLSADGRFVAFSSDAGDLVPGDTNGQLDGFVRDRATGTTTRVTLTAQGDQADEGGTVGGLSADGNVVVFESADPGIVPGDTNRRFDPATGSLQLGDDVFVRDRAAARTERVSLDPAGAQVEGYSGLARDASVQGAVSADGRLVAFGSRAAGLTGDASGVAFGSFVRDRVSGTTSTIVVDPDPTVPGNAVLSADGRSVAFTTEVGLTPADGNGEADVYVRSLDDGATVLASAGPDGAAGDGGSIGPALAADGSAVAFWSGATDLGPAPDDNPEGFDVFLRRLR